MKRLQIKVFIFLTVCSLVLSFSCAAQRTVKKTPLEKTDIVTRQYICIGDSITNGHGNTSFEAYPHQLALLLGGANSYKEIGDPNYLERPLPEGWLIQNPSNVITVINHGIESQKIQSMLANVQSQVGSRLGNADETIVILLGGINDIGQGRSAADVQADWAAYGAWCEANNVKFYIATMTDVTHPNFNAVKAEANTWLRANWQNFADKLIDFGSNEALANANNLAYFDADGVHPNEAGDLRMAEIINRIINNTYKIPVIKTISVPSGGFRAPYNQTLAARGGDGVITWSHRSGALPEGIIFNVISHKFEGIPTIMATFPEVVIRATDATGDFNERIFSILITRKFSMCSRIPYCVSNIQSSL